MATSKVTLRSDAAASLLEPEKTLRASKALVAHMKSEAEKKAATSEKKELLADDDDVGSLAETPVFVTFTTKRHLTESRNLKPTKIPTPHPIETDPEKGICLIVADPQRHYKNLVADSEFPNDLRKNVSRVIDFGKLKKKFTAYENQRALYAEHDIFLADTRIINRLPGLLGKTFYKSQKKRPIPIEIQARIPKSAGKRVKPTKGEVNSCTSVQLAGEINRAVAAALVNLSPSTNHAVKIGYASWKAEELAANAEKVVNVMVNKLIPGGKKNVRSIYLKGPTTVALPIYLTDELWLSKETDVVGDDSEQAKALLAAEKANIGKKRKSLEGAVEEAEPVSKKSKKTKQAKLPESNDDKLDKEIAERKAALKKQKKAAKKALDA
ncbi:ribosomal protein L1p/L10e family-domain-containing protein [Xylaria bambusicola]|uniref:ribosomal protein L1p/L10e family-domain-containing protein n=1 Tax=Xylaria bambusicola TaxID=326684 RepID=UPI0020072650|nr:ribosomal protein L1p/L10e family-domain-containing protein [Xylaria bambusicola]KAI0508483.1 ribosomal protein L1p/L10e family-domain-containing protein [Xylaria bambusicola]